MSEPDDWDDPSLGRPRTGPSFWATVRWRWRFILFISGLAGGLIFGISTGYYALPDAAKLGAIVAGGLVVLCFASRVLWAWLEWPSESRPMRWVKAAMRVLFFDTEAERRAADNDRPGARGS